MKIMVEQQRTIGCRSLFVMMLLQLLLPLNTTSTALDSPGGNESDQMIITFDGRWDLHFSGRYIDEFYSCLSPRGSHNTCRISYRINYVGCAVDRAFCYNVSTVTLVQHFPPGPRDANSFECQTPKFGSSDEVECRRKVAGNAVCSKPSTFNSGFHKLQIHGKLLNDCINLCWVDSVVTYRRRRRSGDLPEKGSCETINPLTPPSQLSRGVRQAPFVTDMATTSEPTEPTKASQTKPKEIQEWTVYTPTGSTTNGTPPTPSATANNDTPALPASAVPDVTPPIAASPGDTTAAFPLTHSIATDPHTPKAEPVPVTTTDSEEGDAKPKDGQNSGLHGVSVAVGIVLGCVMTITAVMLAALIVYLRRRQSSKSEFGNKMAPSIQQFVLQDEHDIMDYNTNVDRFRTTATATPSEDIPDYNNVNRSSRTATPSEDIPDYNNVNRSSATATASDVPLYDSSNTEPEYINYAALENVYSNTEEGGNESSPRF